MNNKGRRNRQLHRLTLRIHPIILFSKHDKLDVSTKKVWVKRKLLEEELDSFPNRDPMPDLDFVQKSPKMGNARTIKQARKRNSTQFSFTSFIIFLKMELYMPLYDYRCTTCGDFEQWLQISDLDLQVHCSSCEQVAKRLFSVPNISLNIGRFPQQDQTP